MKKQRLEILRYSGRRRRTVSPLRIAAAVLLILAAICAFAVPSIRFSGALLAALAALCLFWDILNRWAARSRSGVVWRRAFYLCCAAGLAAFVCTEGMIVSAGRDSGLTEPVDAVIVLGAGVNGKTPSLALRSRIDTAEVYLTSRFDVPVILSGGQGRGESVSEARAMYDAMIADGVDASRLYLEEDSTTTAENFANSRALLRRIGVDTDTAKIAVVTNDFHIFRAQLLAERTGIQMIGIPASLPWRWLRPNYYAREVFAVWKTVLPPWTA